MKALQTRKDAIANNSKTYVGSPCRNCNKTLRYTNGNSCLHCMRVRVRSKAKKDYDKKYHLANAEKKMRVTKEWIKANPDKRAAIIFNYAAKRRTNKKDGVKPKDLLAWVNAQKKICYWCDCQCEDSFHIDHYEALSKGGKHDLDNLVIACPACNLKKNAKDPYEFARSKGKLF
jgi:5-methylcytosine-specific restriction endonuclease McrA